MDETILVSSLQLLSQLLYRHYGQKTIILIDEYDVPLDKAFQHGYYRNGFPDPWTIRQALKTNDALQFAVLTGCSGIEGKYFCTGLNNFKVLSITDARLMNNFGFTEQEVSELLERITWKNIRRKQKEWYGWISYWRCRCFCP